MARQCERTVTVTKAYRGGVRWIIVVTPSMSKVARLVVLAREYMSNTVGEQNPE